MSLEEIPVGRASVIAPVLPEEAPQLTNVGSAASAPGTPIKNKKGDKIKIAPSKTKNDFLKLFLFSFRMGLFGKKVFDFFNDFSDGMA